MKCITKLSLVFLSCLSLTKGAVIPTESRNVDLSAFFSNLLDHQQQSPVNNDVKEVTQVAGVTANPTEINDEYTQEDIRKYTKFLVNLITSENGANQPAVNEAVTTTTTTTALTTTTTSVATTTSASGLLNDIRDLSSELDSIKERRVDEIDELIDIIKNVSERLETLETTVEQSLNKQEIPNTVDDTKEVDLNHAEIDDGAQVITPINENDLKYAAIFNAFNKENEEKIATMQQNEMKLLEEIKELLTNNNNAQINTGKAMVAAEEVQDKEVKENDNANANAAPPPETSEESIIEQKNNENEEFEKLYQEISKNIDDYKSMVSKNENVTSDEQFTKAAMIRDKTKTIKQYINKLTSLAENDDQKNKVKEINDKYDNVESNHIEKVNNDQEIVKDEAAAKEAAKEDAENAEAEKPKNVISINHAKKIISEIAASTTNEAQVDEVQRIIKEIQLNDQVEDAEKEAANVDEDEAVAKALNEVASNSMNDEQVEEVRKFIKSIEAKAIIDENLKKEEVIKKLIFDISANSTNEEQVHQIQRILEKIELYNKFTEEKQQEREDNLAFGHEMAEEIQKTPDEISNDLKNLLVNLVNQATTEEEAANVANIITQIKKHDELIKEKQAADNEQYVKVPNTEAYMIDLTDGTSNEVYLKEDQEIIDQPVAKNEVPVINLEEIDDTESHKGMYILGAFGVLALAGFGYSYRSKAKKLNDEFPFSDNNLPFSNSMNGLVVDKNFLLRKNSIPKPENIINNDAVIRPSQPSWATSILMDENNKKGLKDSIQMTEDPEQLLDEQLREIENKEKVIVNKAANTPSVVITIDENNATTEVTEESPKPKQKKAAKKPKLRRSISVISLDKKAKEDKEETANTEKKRSKKEKKDKKQKKSRKTKSLIIEKVKEEPKELDEDVELSLNTSFILDAPSLLFNDEEIVEAKKNNSLLNTEKPNLPKRISSCTPETKEVLPTVQESEEILPVLTELENEDSECQFSQEFAKELMEDYNKKFGEMEN